MASGPPPPYAPPDGNKAGYYPPGGYNPQNPGYAPPGPGYPPAGGYPPPAGGYPPAGYPAGAPPPPGFQAPYQPQPMAPPQQQSVVVVAPGAAVGTGNCPVCRNGYIVEDFTCCGICLAIFFFPLGLICCLLMRDRRCNRCGAVI